MIRKKSEMRNETRQNMRGGIGDTSISHMFEANELLNKARFAGYITVPVGGSIGYHVHDTDAEIIIVSSGKACAVENGISYELNVGDTMFTGGGASHSFENIGDTPLTLIGIVIN